MEKILVSACLAGVLCKYNGTYNDVPEIIRMVEQGKALPVCPELMGGGGVPREPNEIVGGDGRDVLEGKARVITSSGQDCTDMFVLGAQKVLEKAKMLGARVAILKERSPSCGSNVIYDGSFTGNKKPGMGVTASLLTREGIKVYSENNFKEVLAVKK